MEHPGYYHPTVSTIRQNLYIRSEYSKDFIRTARVQSLNRHNMFIPERVQKTQEKHFYNVLNVQKMFYRLHKDSLWLCS